MANQTDLRAAAARLLYCDNRDTADYDMLIAFIDETFREKEEREKPPLTMAELRQMHGETVYCLDLNTEVKISAPKVGFITISYAFPGEWGSCKANGLTLYRSRPKEETP